LDELLEHIRQRIDRDFGGPRLGHPGVSFIRYAEWIRTTGTKPPVGDSADIDPDEPVCVAGGRSFPISMTDGVEAAVVTVASALQDDVMDRLGRPWPFVNIRGQVAQSSNPNWMAAARPSGPRGPASLARSGTCRARSARCSSSPEQVAT